MSEKAPAAPADLRWLWPRAAAIWGHRFVSALGDSPQDDAGNLTPAGEMWSRGLVGLTAEDFALGLTAAIVRGDGWPPSLPEFRAMCLGVPSLAEMRARLGIAPHLPGGFGRLMSRNIDWHRYKSGTPFDANRIIEDAYELTKMHVMAGGKLPEDPLKLPPPVVPPHTPATPETVERCTDAIRRWFGERAMVTQSIPVGPDGAHVVRRAPAEYRLAMFVANRDVAGEPEFEFRIQRTSDGRPADKSTRAFDTIHQSPEVLGQLEIDLVIETYEKEIAP